jgi:cytochrome oxidase assembly protein ShyY1
VVALLEDWVAAAEAIAENEAAVAEALETDAGDSEVVAGLRRKIAELTLVMDARAAEQAAWASKEAEARARAKGLAHEVAEAEQLLAGLAAALEADQGVAADANSAKKLAAFDLAKVVNT